MRKKIMVLFAGLQFCASDAQDVVRIGTAADYEPWTHLQKGEPVGYDIDIIKEICKSQALACEISVQPWETLFDSLRFKKYDLIIDGISHTPMRERIVQFGDVYTLDRSELIVRVDSDVVNICVSDCVSLIDGFAATTKQKAALTILANKLQSYVIGAQNKSAQMASVHDLFPRSEVIGFKNKRAAVAALKAGKIDAVYDSELTMKTLLEKNKDLVALKTKFAGGHLGPGMAIAFRKGDKTHIKHFNDGLRALIASGKLKVLSLKWFGADVTPSGAQQ